MCTIVVLARVRPEAPLVVLANRDEFYDRPAEPPQVLDSESGAVELCPPQGLDAETCERLQERALRAFRALDCEGYARIDFLVPDDGEPVFLEANTLPGFTPRSPRG